MIPLLKEVMLCCGVLRAMRISTLGCIYTSACSYADTFRGTWSLDLAGEATP